MKKIFLSIAFIATGLVASAQVGVGTTNPETSLEVVGANADATTKAPGALNTADGITVPVVTTDMTIALPGIAAGTRVSQMVYSTFAGKEGYYFWDGAKWNSMVPAAAVVPTRSARVATNNVITNADINGFIIDNAGRTYDLTTLSGLVDGVTISFMQLGPIGLSVNGVVSGSGEATFQQGTGVSYVYDAETNGWYSWSGF